MLKIDPHGQYETFAFHKLPIDVQAGLIGQAQKAIDRALTDMAAMRSITVPEYATYLKEGQLLKRELDTVLKSPKFAEVDAQPGLRAASSASRHGLPMYKLIELTFNVKWRVRTDEVADVLHTITREL